MVYNWLNFSRTWWPWRTRCCLCQGVDGSDLGLCSACLSDLPRLEPACPRCAMPLAHAAAMCALCQQHAPAFDSCQALFAYAPPLDQLIWQLKFHQALHLARLFAGLLAERLRNQNRPDVIIPVPLHPRRLRQRGYNQALEIARPLAAALNCQLDLNSCRRVANNPPQAGLDASQRRANVRDAFLLTGDPSARSVALVDDVMTTGSTVNALARLLRRAGVQEIQVWVCARAVGKGTTGLANQFGKGQ